MRRFRSWGINQRAFPGCRSGLSRRAGLRGVVVRRVRRCLAAVTAADPPSRSVCVSLLAMLIPAVADLGPDMARAESSGSAQGRQLIPPKAEQEADRRLSGSIPWSAGGHTGDADAKTFCGAPGSGNCMIPNPTPFCDNASCCQFICSFDPYCCQVEWDLLCALQAQEAPGLCAVGGGPTCGTPGTGDCHTATGTPYCENAACCQSVCAFDPYCCQVEWDGLCAAWAAQFPAACGASPCQPDFSVLAPGTWAGNTCGAGNNCASLPSEEHVYEVTLLEAGNWRFSLCGSAYDTVLIIGTNPGGFDVGVNDDSCGLQSELTVLLDAGTYYVTIEGFASFHCGNYVLTIEALSCDPPPVPTAPEPPMAVGEVSPEATLCWDWGGSLLTEGRPEIIYGVDDRLDEYEVADPALRTAGASTVAVVDVADLADNGDGTYSLPGETLAEFYLSATGRPLCNDERFRDQPSAAFCSGFLVAPDVVASAGHCIQNDFQCRNTAFVFGFVMLDRDTPVLTVPAKDVYFCEELIQQRFTFTEDWGLYRLDRAVDGYAPLPVRLAGVVPNAEPVMVVGHPMGIPRKYAGGAIVRENNHPHYFQADLDAYGGNSGSAVFNLNSLDVEGVLVRGWPDFVQDGPCDRSNVCDPIMGCPGWEHVTRTILFSGFIPSYDVYFGLCSEEPVLQTTTTQTCWTPPPLDGDTYYCWYVVARNHCPDGVTEGPLWWFATGPLVPLSADAGPDLAIVGGNSIELEASVTGGEPPYSYAWSPELALNNPQVLRPTASPGETTTYTLTVTDAASATSEATVTVTVVPPLIVDAGPDRTISTGSSTTLLASVSGGAPPYTYAWSPKRGLSDATVLQPTAAPAPVTATLYTLTATDSIGTKASDTVLVTVRAQVAGGGDADAAPPLPNVAIPVVSPDGGTFVDAVEVSLATATADAAIRYTTDGSEPTADATLYDGPFVLTSSATIRARGFREGFAPSAIASAAFTVEPVPKAAAPIIAPNGGTFVGPVPVSLSSATPGAVIRYTTDGDEATSSSPAYTAPFGLTSSGTVRARAFREGYEDSDEVSASFTIRGLVPPTQSVPGDDDTGAPAPAPSDPGDPADPPATGAPGPDDETEADPTPTTRRTVPICAFGAMQGVVLTWFGLTVIQRRRRSRCGRNARH